MTQPATRGGMAAEPELFLQPHPVVVAADRPVCSLLSGYKRDAGITGQDGSASVFVEGTAYWSFGDTTMADGSMLPNSLGKSGDMDAADCISLVPKGADGHAEALLPQAPGELTVWPGGMVSTGSGRVHFAYTSVVRDADSGHRVAGVGLASFDTATLTSTRAKGGALLWRRGEPMPSQMFSDGTYVYFLLHTSRDRWTTDVLLARVPTASIESPAGYQYWQPGSAFEPGRWLSDLWNQSTGSWSNTISDLRPIWRQRWLKNGGGVAYNEFLGRWLAVYAGDILSAVRFRTATDLTGPWEASDTLGVDCRRFHPQPTTGFLCYAGTQHAEYARDGGRTIYVSYANSGTYQVYLHEIRLASPVHQWSNATGQTTLVVGAAPGPAGFSEDGISFYASDIPAVGLSEIRGWRDEATGTLRYGPSSPGQTYRAVGAAFYAPADPAAADATNASYAPVYRWTKGGIERYSMLDLGQQGYMQQELAFYGACPDTDNDRLSDCTESFLSTDIANADTDGDGLEDGFEYSTPGCSPLTYTDDGDGIAAFDEAMIHTNPCLADTDGDGCSDGREPGSEPTLGGGRDPTDPWDFFDTPDGNGVRDGMVRMADILRVLYHYGDNDPAFDRSYSATSTMRLGPGDGQVTMFEVLHMRAQYGHSCV